MIQFDIEDRRVLDLFAGSGQLGIEALSRGARSCTFVENNRGAMQVVQRNLTHCGLEEKANTVFSDAVSFLNRSGTYDLVLLDPPYGKGILQRVLPALVPRLSENAMVVCESGRDEKLPQQVGPFVLDRERRHGKTKIALYLRGKDLAE